MLHIARDDAFADGEAPDDLPPKDLAEIERQTQATWGLANPDYVRSTYEHLVEMGVRDPILARLVEALA